MHKKKITRRSFLRLGSLTTASALLAACAPGVAPAVSGVEDMPAATATPVSPAEVEAPSTASDVSPNQAPMFQEMVRAGELPPLDERLPQSPIVVEPLNSIGTYGGDWLGATVETNGNFLIRNGGYQQLLRWTPTWDAIIPNLAEYVEANDEATEFVFKLREGIRYSDGEPMTANDVMFWYEDVLLNEDLTPTTPGVFSSRDGSPVQMEQLDDYTFKFTFAGPQGLFLKEITQTNTERVCHYPRHYLEQFHPNYNSDVDSLAESEGYGTWYEMFGTKSTPHNNAELPSLWPWKLENALGEGTTERVTAARNPYFYKVDPEGNQLPYIDRYVMSIFSDVEVLLLDALNGELDFQERFISAPRNKAVLFDNQAAGDFHFFELTPTTVNEFIIQFNMNCTDPVKREIFQNKNFRIAMSYAIDRQEIIDVVHVGQGEAWQASPRPESIYHHERLAKQYTEYDPDMANQLLDEAGFTERDNEGFRLGPDGERISFVMDLDQARTTYIDAMELIKPRWADVGVEVLVRTMERSLWEERCRGTSLDFHASGHRFGGGSGEAVILDARYWLPMNDGSSMFAKAWSFWYNDTNPELAEEPPENVKRAMELYDAIALTADADEQYRLMMEILDIAADEFYAIGTVLEPNAFGVVTNRMRNVPEVIPNSWIYPTPAPYNPEQFYIDEA